MNCWNLDFFKRFTVEEALRDELFDDVSDCYFDLKLPK